MVSPNGSWHSETVARFRTLSDDSLRFIRKDAHEAAVLGDSLGSRKAGRYWDEFHYAAAELARRAKSYS